MERFDITLLGGDARIAYMAPCLLEKKCRVICYGTQKLAESRGYPVIYAKNLEEAVEQAECIVGGIPLLKDKKICSGQSLPDMEEDELYRHLKKGQMVFGGVIPENFMEQCRQREISCHDFMKDEPLAVLNAVATAEGAILEALKWQKTNIHGSESLVVGYGRCGKVLAEKLKGLDARVTVCSSSEVELACADTFGMDTLPLGKLEQKISAYEYIYNTVPAVVLDRKVLGQIRQDALVIDIASGAGGVDYFAAGELGVSAFHCLGLPGKYAPKISAKLLADFVIRRYQADRVIE